MAVTNTTNNDPQEAAQDAAFEARHKDDLSAKTFVKRAGFETFVPLAAMAAGGLVGWYTLGTPIQKLFPGFFKFSGHAGDIIAHLGLLTGEGLSAAKNTISSQIPNVISRAKAANKDFKLESMKSIKELLGHATEEEIQAVKSALGAESRHYDDRMAKAVGAGVLGTLSSLVGSVFVGFDKWKREESTRLAAQEIDRDISRLEVFGKRDPELVAENKRLRETIAQTENPDRPRSEHHRVAEMTHEGKINSVEKQRQHA